MKLFFLKQDSLYKLFTTLEKIPKNSQVEIFIESENQFFNNPWRSKQIDNILTKRSIKATFIAQNDHQRQFFEHNNINHEIKKESKLRLFLNLVYWFFFNIKKFHLHTYHNKSYSFFAIFGAEILLIIGAGYSIYSLILPKTTIVLTPSYDMNEVVYNFRYLYPQDLESYPFKERHITVPMYTGTVQEARVSMSINKKNREEGTFLKGTLRLINTTSNPISLKINTQVIDDFGIEYTMDDKALIPAAQKKDQAGVSYVAITSKNDPNNNALVQEKAEQITLGQRFLIKNLRQSFYTKQIYGEASEGFDIKQYSQPGYVLLSDIGELQKSLYANLQSKKKEYITSEYIPAGGILLLPFEELMSVDNCQYQASGDSQQLDHLKVMSGSLSCSINFSYVLKDDIIEGMKTYISKRSTNARKVVSIQNNFLTFFDILTGEYNAYIIPTRANVIESYNLQSDINKILPRLKDQIVGKTELEAQHIIQTFSELEKAKITISPFWYNTITTIKSRIRIKLNDTPAL